MTTSEQPGDWAALSSQAVEDVLSSMEEHLFVLDSQGRYLLVNSRVAEALGKSPQELIGQSLWKLFPHLVGTLFHAAVQATAADRKPRQLETYDEARDRWFENSICPAAGGIAVLIRDITRRKRAESEARTSAERLRQLTDALPALIWSAGPDGALHFCNRRLLDYLEVTLEQVAGKAWLKAVHPDDVERVEQAWSRAVATGQEYENVFRLRRASDGQYRWFLVRGTPLTDEQGRVQCWYGTATNIEAYKRTEEALRRSEEHLRAVTESIPTFVWSARSDGCVDYFNQQALEYAGLSLGDLQRQGCPDWLHPEDRDRVKAAWRRAVLTKESIDIDCRLRRASDGQYRWFTVRGQPLRDKLGRAIRWFGIGTDVEERKRAEETLQRNEQLLAHSQAAAHIGSYMIEFTEPGNRLDSRTYWSEEMYRILGFEPGEVEPSRETFLSRTHPEDRAGIAAAVDEAFRAGRPFQIQYRIMRPDGERIVRVLGQFELDAEGRPARLWGTVQDITEQQRAATVLQEADRRKNEFLATLAHELRNPLAPIRHAIKIARLPNATESHRQWAYQVIERQAGQMARLLDDLLEASRISRGKIELRKERTDLVAALNTAAEATQPLIEAKRHVLTLDVPDEPIWLEADPVRLTQIFTNLLTNAAKYTDPLGRISVGVALEEHWVTVTVRDNGIGIAPEMLPRIFHMFSQAQAALDRTEGGLGIGLALARGLVERHGGSIEAHSPGPGRGSEFVVKLPITGVSEGQVAPAVQPAAREEGRQRRVLVADDNRDSAESLAMMLRLQGREVEVAHDGRQALTVASIFHPDIVLLDIGMPEFNGYEVARQIRAERWGQSMVLVAVTGWGQEEDKRRAAEAGIDLHLTKPIDPDQLELLCRTLEIAKSDHGTE